jgi:hypothetical protein
MSNSIRSIIPQNRCVIVLGEDIRKELEVLYIIGFEKPTSLFVIIDTVRVVNKVFEFRTAH